MAKKPNDAEYLKFLSECLATIRNDLTTIKNSVDLLSDDVDEWVELTNEHK